VSKKVKYISQKYAPNNLYSNSIYNAYSHIYTSYVPPVHKGIPIRYGGDMDERSWKSLRSRAYRKLKGRIPPGWKTRLTFRSLRFYKKGTSASSNAQSMQEALNSSRFFVTATRYIGTSKEDGMPYLKLFIHPSEGRSWSISNWSSPDNLHLTASFMMKVSREEIDRVFDCMEALELLMSKDPLKEMQGFARVSAMSKWVENEIKST
jgi:hypothetical protein